MRLLTIALYHPFICLWFELRFRSSSFKLPSRVTLNDVRRESWFADLANPDVPLHKLGKSIPHGKRDQELLDLLHEKNVLIPRAIWLLRAFGANETASLSNVPILCSMNNDVYNRLEYGIGQITTPRSIALNGQGSLQSTLKINWTIFHYRVLHDWGWMSDKHSRVYLQIPNLERSGFRGSRTGMLKHHRSWFNYLWLIQPTPPRSFLLPRPYRSPSVSRMARANDRKL